MRATRLPDLHDRQIHTTVRLVTQVRGHRRSDKSRLAILLTYGVGFFLGFSDDVSLFIGLYIAQICFFPSLCYVLVNKQILHLLPVLLPMLLLRLFQNVFHLYTCSFRMFLKSKTCGTEWVLPSGLGTSIRIYGSGCSWRNLSKVLPMKSGLGSEWYMLPHTEEKVVSRPLCPLPSQPSHRRVGFNCSLCFYLAGK